MASKRKISYDGSESKKRKTITLQEKVNIIKRNEKGEKASVISCALGFSRTTVSTILKDVERIMSHVKRATPMNSTVISEQRSILVVGMEKLLMLWIEDNNQRSMPLSEQLICEKARTIFQDLKKEHGKQDDTSETFIASKGWFNRFKCRGNLTNKRMYGEAASADEERAKKFVEKFEKLIEEENYMPQLVFNVDETALNWKQMPNRTYIAKEEKKMPGHKASKERLTLLLGGNCSGNFKLKPLLVYQSENPRASKGILKASLPVFWRSNLTAWVTGAMFIDWFSNCFVPEVERYCARKNLPFKALLLIDNAPGHPASLQELHPNVKVTFMPPNITSLIQPMDQGVIRAFKAYYLRKTFRQAVRATENGKKTLREFWKDFNIYKAVKNIGESWEEITESNMNGVWENVCPSFISYFKGFDEACVNNMKSNCVEIGKELNLDIDESDLTELIESHDHELNNEDLMELGRQMENSVESEEAEPLRQFTIKGMGAAFEAIEKGLAEFEGQDPNAERFAKVYRAVEDALACYRHIYDDKKYSAKQSSILQFFKKVENDPTPSQASTSSRDSTPSRESTPLSPSSSPDSPEAVTSSPQ